MSGLRTISQKASAAGLPLLLIGGYAVMAHGFVRATDDLDLLVQSSRRDQWRRLMEDMGLSLYREAPTFSHAIQHGKALRRVKDTEDLIQLITRNGLNLNEPELQATVLKHGNQELYDKLQQACAPE